MGLKRYSFVNFITTVLLSTGFFCPKAFSQKSDLDRHTRRIHSAEVGKAEPGVYIEYTDDSPVQQPSFHSPQQPQPQQPQQLPSRSQQHNMTAQLQHQPSSSPHPTSFSPHPQQSATPHPPQQQQVLTSHGQQVLTTMAQQQTISRS